MNRRIFLKTNLFGAIGLAAAKIARPVSAAAEIDKSPPGEVKNLPNCSGSSLVLSLLKFPFSEATPRWS